MISKRRFPWTVLHLFFEGEVWIVRRLAEDALVLKPQAVALARSPQPAVRFFGRQGQPLYSSKYRNDSSLYLRESARPCSGLTRNG